jgi:hypothetical protein
MRKIGRVGQVAEGRETVLALGGRAGACDEKENDGGTAGG